MHYLLKISATALLVLLMASHTQSFTDWHYPTLSDHGKRLTEGIQDHEHQKSVLSEGAMVSCNPLLLNGKVFDYENFDIHSRGLLTMIEGKPEVSEASPIPFRVTLKRKGSLLEEHAGATLEGKNELDISLLLAHSHPGDQLIFYPIKKEHCKAKRILLISNDKC